MKNLQKHLLILLILLFATSLTLTGQEWYVKQNGNKVTLTPKENTWVLYIPDTTYMRKKENLNSLGIQEEKTYNLYEKVVVWMESIEKQVVDNIKTALNGTVYYSPVFLLEDDNLKNSSGELFIRWKKSLTDEEIKDILRKYNLRRIDGERNQWLGDAKLYEILPPYHLNSIEVVNNLYKEELVISAEPNFAHTIKKLFNGIPDDPLYSEQWNLEKIEIIKTWNISKGSGTVVAIFDNGVDLTHNDLYDNLLRDGSNNIIGYNATDRGSSNDPHPDGEDAHGTACAGIAGAVTNNNEGIAGIAPETSIMPLQMSYTHPYYGSPYLLTYPVWWVQSLNFAINNGADVVSMSVGLGSSNYEFNTTMSNAVNNGVVLVAASGNSGASSIAYPASNSNVISVGASLQNDSRWSNSQYGSNLDLVAPGGAPSIWTTDRPGNIGYTNIDYVEFSGTSASAPHVAGVVALMKSLVPELSPSQIRNHLHNSADKVRGMRGQNFTPKYGYGRLNALQAIEAIFPKITGPIQVCGPAGYDIVNTEYLPGGFNVSWSWSPQSPLVSTTGCDEGEHGLCVMDNEPSNNVTITASISPHPDWEEDIIITKDNINVGAPQPPKPIVHYNPGMNSVCKGETHMATTGGHPQATDYQWRLIYPDGFSWDLSGGSSSTTFCIDTTGWYTVGVKQKVNGCWSVETQRSFPVENCGTGGNCEGGGLVPKFIVYPNPASSTLNVEATIESDSYGDAFDKNTTYQLKLYNWDAYLTHTSGFTLQESSQQVDISHLRKGKYILHITGNGELLHIEQVVIE